ncbi:hypothetical protein K0M31_013139 [Melipona bicolor]|uniref:Uncharacterized protein n=1 Tax=Melipona bicolor TaxID=60889 RepID=A0AA40KGU5_9HYME|nr:hypothetical protein K0M31_013139 [Melipona bicolor]
MERVERVVEPGGGERKTRRRIEADKTKCFGPGKEEAGGYNGYLYYRREKAKPTKGSQLPKWSWYRGLCNGT